MKKMFLTCCLFVAGIAAFSQTSKMKAALPSVKTNGVIYINHPYIGIVNKTTKAYLAKDSATNKKLYSDTGKFWASGMEKPISIKEAIRGWVKDFVYFDSITIADVGYPDYLQYVKDDAKVVQSWGVWSGKSKKTGEWIKIDFAQFDFFNKAGKITLEGIYGDFSKMMKEEED